MANNWTELNKFLKKCSEKQAVALMEQERRTNPEKKSRLLRIHKRMNYLRDQREVKETRRLLTVKKKDGFKSRLEVVKFLGKCDEKQAQEAYDTEMASARPRVAIALLIRARASKLRAKRERSEIMAEVGNDKDSGVETVHEVHRTWR